MVAVNPYHWYPELFNELTMKAYAEAYAWNKTSKATKGGLEPHIYEVSSTAYRNMMMATKDAPNHQSILALGIVGASKTESIKLCTNHLVYLQHGPPSSSSNTNGNHSQSAAAIAQALLSATPALEAFGHAITNRNKNSSRYGKYTELQFESSSSTASHHCPPLVACKWHTFGLERSRVVTPREGERNFHVFYQLLSVPDKKKTKYWEGIEGKTVEDFSYLQTDSEWEEIREGMPDSKCFKETLDSLAIIGIDKVMRHNMMRALCVILQLGNLRFEDDPKIGQEGCKIVSEEELAALSGLMGVPADQLIASFTVHKVVAGGTAICKKPVSTEVAKQGCDALAMEIYDRMFSLLLRKLNQATNGNDENTTDRGTIGLLDVPGFENNATNGLDQMLINFMSEKVHQKYLEVVLTNVKASIDKEGIEYKEDNVKFQVNRPILDLIDGPSGVMSTLNDVTRSNGTDDKFLQRVVQNQRKSSHFVPAKSSFTLEFGIRHTVEVITYQVKNFVSENSVHVPLDLVECVAQCSNELLAQEFQTTTQQQQQQQQHRSNNVPSTWTRSKKQFSDVWTRVLTTQPNFIQCIKPNDVMRPKIMLHVDTVHQLQTFNTVEALKLQRIASSRSGTSSSP